MPERLGFVCPQRRNFSIFWDVKEWYVIYRLCSPLRWAEYGIQVHFQIKWDWLSLRSWNFWTTRIRLSAAPQFQYLPRFPKNVSNFRYSNLPFYERTHRWAWQCPPSPIRGMEQIHEVSRCHPVCCLFNIYAANRCRMIPIYVLPAEKM